MNVNRRDMLGSLAGILPVLATGVAAATQPEPLIKMEAVELKSDVGSRSLRDISDLDTDFIEARAKDDKYPWRQLAVVLDGKMVDRVTYANCVTGEVHRYGERPADMPEWAETLMTCTYGKVQIFFAKPEYHYHYQPTGNQVYPWPHANFDSPERKMVQDHFANQDDASI